MPFNVNAVIAEIDGVLAKYEEVAKNHRTRAESGTYYYIGGPEDVRAEITTLLSQAISRLQPVADYGARAIEHYSSGYNDRIMVLAGVLRALRDDYASGRILSVQERIRSDLFSDFLEMAEYLIVDEGLKDPAAVMAGGVLEQHLRKLCENHGIPTTFPADGQGRERPKMTDAMNNELARQGAYGKNDQKQIAAWAGIRNSAAHGEYGNYNAEQAKLMISGIRDFISRYPA
jgi:hypothetical protein